VKRSEINLIPTLCTYLGVVSRASLISLKLEIDVLNPNNCRARRIESRRLSQVVGKVFVFDFN
jgi:hypothetical protein